MLILFFLFLKLDNHIPVYEVDKIEYNHYSNDGVKYDQIIFWDFDYSLKQFVVLDYFLIKEGDNFSFNRENKYTKLIFSNFKTFKKPLIVKTKTFIETTTNIDPERINRSILHERNRICPYNDLMYYPRY